MSLHHHTNQDQQDGQQEGFLGSRAGLVLLGFLAIGGFLLFTEHRAHVLGALIWVLPLACVFMHFSMHGGHSGHGSQGKPDERNPS